MSKFCGKNAIILINGYNLSTYGSAFEVQSDSGAIDVTGFTDGSKNFIPGMKTDAILADLFWSSTSGAVHTALGGANPATGHVTVLPEGYVLGNLSMSLPFMQANYSPKGTPAGALEVGTINFISYGDNEGVEYGNVLGHASVTAATTTGVGVEVNAAPVTAECSGTLHVWAAPASETTSFKIQHCTTLGGVYADLITFTIDGTDLTSERVAVASGTINQFVRVLVTKSSTVQTLGFTIHYRQSV
jgi:hypothetical protein